MSTDCHEISANEYNKMCVGAIFICFFLCWLMDPPKSLLCIFFNFTVVQATQTQRH